MTLTDRANSPERTSQPFQRALVIADGRRVIRAVDPDAVVLDIDFGPGPTGFDLADAIRSQTPTSQSPF